MKPNISSTFSSRLVPVLCCVAGALASGGAVADAVVMVPAGVVATQAAQGIDAFRDAEVSAKVVKTPAGLGLSLSAAGVDRPSVVALGAAVDAVSAIKRSGDKLLVLGRLGPGDAAEVSVIDLRALALFDRFWAIQPALSPDGKLIAFVRFYPLGGVVGRESQYRVYRLGLSPVQNRSEFAKPAPGDIGPSALQDVGFALYPSYGGKPAQDNTDVPESLAHQHGSALFWSADSKSVGFVDAQGGTARTVVVSFADDASVNRVRVARLASLGNLCLRGAAVRGCKMMPIESVTLKFETAADAVRVTLLDRSSNQAMRTLDLPLNSFVPAE